MKVLFVYHNRVEDGYIPHPTKEELKELKLKFENY